MGRLAGIENSERPALRRGAALATLGALVWVPQAWLIAGAVDALLAGAPIDRVLSPAVWVVALAGLRAALEYAGDGIAFAAATRVVTTARAALAESIARRSPLDASAPLSGAVAALGADQLELLVPYLTRYAGARARVTVVPAVLAVAVATVSWAAALVLLAAGPLIPVFMALVGMAAKQASTRQMAELGSMNGLLLDRLRGLAEIRLLDAVDRAAGDFAVAADTLRRETMAVLRIAFLSSTVLELFAALGVAMVAVLVGFTLLGTLSFGGWGEPMTLGGGLFVLMLAPAFFQPLRDLAAAWHDRAEAAAVADAFDGTVGDDGMTILGADASAAPLPGPATIRLRAVGSARIAAAALDLDIPAGARVAITGPSGAGKSTLLAILAGLATPDSGRIEVAGQPLEDGTAAAWRARLAWVGQRPHFVAGSLRANVALSGDPRDRERVRAALRHAAAEDFAARLPGGLDAPLGETGGLVSGGEGRRLAIARAAFAGRDVVLADEPTANLDAETAREVADGLLALADAGATLVVATHDPALAARLDREIRLGGPA